MQLMILTSAGTLSPPLISTISPLTSFYAGRIVTFPSLNTAELDANMFLKPYISAYDFAPCINVIAPVKRTTIIKIMAR